MSEELQQEAVETPAQAPIQLQLQDLLLAAQVIQLASQRGAIKPEEFTAVGRLYERLVTFLQASGALKSPDAPADEAATDAEAPAA